MYFRLEKDERTAFACFERLPKWFELAFKIYLLFEIPPDCLGVVDINGITLRCDEDLRRSYESIGDSVIRLFVKDLRLADASTTTTTSSTIGNFFRMANGMARSIISSRDIELPCWMMLETSRPTFVIKINKNVSVDSLKHAIKKKKESTLVEIDVDELEIWKLSLSGRFHDISTRVRQASSPEDIPCCEQLCPLDKLSQHFSPANGARIYVVVKIHSPERPLKRRRIEAPETSLMPERPLKRRRIEAPETSLMPCPCMDSQEIEPVMA